MSNAMLKKKKIINPYMKPTYEGYKYAVVDYAGAGTQDAINVDEDIQKDVDRFFERENKANLETLASSKIRQNQFAIQTLAEAGNITNFQDEAYQDGKENKALI